jgi:hypothetical protein
VLFNHFGTREDYIASVIDGLMLIIIDGMIPKGKTEVLGEKLAAVPLCPPQIPHAQTWD